MKKNKSSSIDSAKQIVKEKSREIVNKMSKLTDHLDMIKEMDIKDVINIYEREKNILESLYDYYCRFQKVYFDLSFSRILNPVDTATIMNIDIKDFVNQIKSYHKHDYEITISSLKEGDIDNIKEIL
jgi:hypothetical protein